MVSTFRVYILLSLRSDKIDFVLLGQAGQNFVVRKTKQNKKKSRDLVNNGGLWLAASLQAVKAFKLSSP